MFKKVIATPGFWKSVFSLGLAFMVLFIVVKWAIEGFAISYFTETENPILVIMGLFVSGFIYGFLASYGKFSGKIKKDEQRNH